MSHQATAPDLLHYRHLDPLYRAAVGDRLHHGLWKDPRLSLAAAQSALETEVADIITGLQPQRVLDVGCGYGHLLRSLAPTGIPHLAGVNANPEQLHYAQRATPTQFRSTIAWHLGHWPAVPAAQPWDALIFLESFEHLPEPELAVAAAFDQLRPGGHLIVIGTHRVSSDPPLRQTLRRAHYHPGLLTHTELIATASHFGFQRVRSCSMTPCVRDTWIHLLRVILRWGWRHPIPAGRWFMQHPSLAASSAIGMYNLHRAYQNGHLGYALTVWQRPLSPMVSTHPG